MTSELLLSIITSLGKQLLSLCLIPLYRKTQTNQ